MEDQRSVEEETSRPQRRDARENRQTILAVAKQLFADQGVDATSMHEIARAAGVGQGTLYRHFAHKGELCRGLIGEDIAAFQERLGARIEGDAPGSPLERLDLLMAEKTRLTESHLPLFAAMDETASGGRRIKPFRGPFYIWQHEHITTLLNEAIAQGEIGPLDVAFAADAILAATAPPLYNYQRKELGFSNERIIIGLRRLFVEGLRVGVTTD